MTTTERLIAFPPIFVRLLARHKSGKPLTAIEIAARSEVVSTTEVWEYSRAVSWAGMSLYTSLAFMRGCNLDFDDAKAWRRVRDYLAHKPTFQYLRADPHWKDYFQPLMMRWIAANTPLTAGLWPPLRDLLVRLTPLLQPTSSAGEEG